MNFGSQDIGFLIKKSLDLMLMQRAQEALETINKVIEINPFLDDVWAIKAIILKSLEKTKEALECIDHALNLNPQNEKARSIRFAIVQTSKFIPRKIEGEAIDLHALTKKIKNLVENGLKSDTFYQEEFILFKEGGN
ncbi:MAG: hypothetical protein ACTSVV_11935 [Promethearchaeota archaeon]